MRDRSKVQSRPKAWNPDFGSRLYTVDPLPARRAAPPNPQACPSLVAYVLLAATCFVAYTNGANDNFKGVASLFGSGTVRYRTAVLWATGTTFLGSLASLLLAGDLLRAFSAKGLVPLEIANQEAFLLSVALGAGATVFLATRTGFPISTTHSLVGGIVGAGFLAAGPDLDAGRLVSVFVMPLLVSPFLALLLAGTGFSILRRVRPSFRDALDPLTPEPQSPALDRAHFVSAGVVSFARGLNDTPKIAGLLAVSSLVDVEGSFVMIALAIAGGGLLSARRVAMTMSRKITGMHHRDGFVANVATGFLVIVASRFGVPVSTTHVSVGALFGIGIVTGHVHGEMSRNVVLSWVVTLPCAAAVSALAYGVVG